MTLELTGLLAALVGIIALFAPVRRAVALMAVSTTFGTAAAISLPALGGASVLVPSVFLGFFALRIIGAYGPAALLDTLRLPGPGFWLMATTVLGLASCYFLPRLFAGEAEVMSLVRNAGGRNLITLSPLGPSPSNITQGFYALGGFVCFAAAATYGRRTGVQEGLIGILLAVAGLNLAFAVADLVTFYTGTAWLMDFIRTADYALQTASEKGGLKRISGSFSEASAFAAYTLTVFACTASLWLDRARSLWCGPLAALSLIALVISTSATALVGVMLIGGWLGFRTILTGMTRPAFGRPLFLLVVAIVAPLLLLQMILFLPDVTAEAQRFIDEILLSKSTSQSGVERFEWNAAALRTFVDTGGFGAGLGSARASSFALTVLSNIGLAGFLLFAAFAVTLLNGQTGWRVARDADTLARAQVARAAKCGCVAVLVSATISGSVYDLGLLFYFLAGTAAGQCLPVRRGAPQMRHAPQPRVAT